MTLNRYAARRDANEADIVSALERAGCRVEYDDSFDLIVQRGTIPAARTYLLEVKSYRGRLTQRQQKRLADGWDVHVVRTPEDALKVVGL